MTKNYETENRTAGKTSDKNEMNSRNERNCHKNSTDNKAAGNKTTNAYDAKQNKYSDRY